jgi:MFS family permease
MAATDRRSFNHAELASYLGSAFTLTNTAGIPLYGVLLDSLGRKYAMGTASFFFGVGSLACALAPSMGWLIAARAFAGVSHYLEIRTN